MVCDCCKLFFVGYLYDYDPDADEVRAWMCSGTHSKTALFVHIHVYLYVHARKVKTYNYFQSGYTFAIS